MALSHFFDHIQFRRACSTVGRNPYLLHDGPGADSGEESDSACGPSDFSFETLAKLNGMKNFMVNGMTSSLHSLKPLVSPKWSDSVQVSRILFSIGNQMGKLTCFVL